MDILFATTSGDDSEAQYEKRVCGVWQREWLQCQNQSGHVQPRICFVATTNRLDQTNNALYRRFNHQKEVRSNTH